MGWMGTVVREVWGLFVDDGWFAVAIVVWVGLVWAGVRYLQVVNAETGAAVLFVGLGAILVESLWRSARGRVR